jgi:hypothetical protein
MLSLEFSLILAILFYILVVLVHVLIIKKVIPHTLISGGRIASFEKQAKISRSSIFIALLGLFFVLLGYLSPSIRKTLIYSILAFILSAFWIFSLVMQLLGTKFERYVMSMVVLLGVLSHVSLALLSYGEWS